MKVLVPVKRVIDPFVKIQVKSDHSGIMSQNAKMAINPFDEIAIEQSVRWAENKQISEIIAVSIGERAVQETLRQALAFGAHRAIHMETSELLEPLSVAKILKYIVNKENPNIVIMGKQAIDDDCNQTGQMLAALLNWPQATFASKITLEDETAEVTREIDGGLETLKVRLPCVITTDLRLNEPRYLTLPNIMKAKNKPLDVVALKDLTLDLTPRIKLKTTEPPQARQAGIKVKDVHELIDYLRNKEKVL